MIYQNKLLTLASVKRFLLVALPLTFLVTTFPADAATKSSAKTSNPNRGLLLAENIATITGVAISPLRGVGRAGAWNYFSTPRDRKDDLHWYARPWLWLPMLLLVGIVAAKDSVGTVMPPGLKKPLDVAETVESKISGLVGAGASATSGC